MSIFKLPLGFAKRNMAKGEKKFNDSHRSYGNYNVKKDLSYVNDGLREHKLDIYTPVKDWNGITLLTIHGGGYVHGWKETNSVFISWFVNKGFSVVSMNYRLASQFDDVSFPDQVRDVFAVLKFIEENWKHYGISKDKLCLMGDSSGGHLALISDIVFHDKEAQDFYKIEKLPNVKIHAIALNSTMYDYAEVIKLGQKLLSKKSCKELFSKHYLDSEYVKLNNPKYYLHKKISLEPLFANSAAKDFFNKQTRLLKKDCDKLGYSLEYIFEPVADKRVGHVYNHFILDDEEGIRCNEAMVNFFIKNVNVDK